MPRDETEVVSELQRELTRRIGRERFDLWFGQQTRLEIGDGQIFVRTGSQFMLDRLRKQFAGEIQGASQHLFGRSMSLVFSVEPACPAVAGAVQASLTPNNDSAPTPGQPWPDGAGGGGSASSRRSRTSRTRYARLDQFVVGSENRVAYTASQTVTERPGSVTPFFLYGPTGCGKTHLLEGIWSNVRQQTRFGRALLLSAEQFTTHFLEALRGGGLPSFRRKCRDVQLLAIDDIQFFAGKRATIVELQHTVDALLRQGRQMVVTADRPPAVLGELGSELIARFSGGLVCAIDPAEYETRLRIAQQLAVRLQVKIPQDVLELVATELCGDARQICGALNRLQATSQALERPVTIDMARTTLLDVFRATQRAVRLGDIERAVCDVFGLEQKSLREARKTKAIAHPRMLAMWLARKYTRAAFSEISQYFGRRSHSTVISAEKKVNGWVAQGSSIQLGQEACNVQDAIRRVELQLRTG